MKFTKKDLDNQQVEIIVEIEPKKFEGYKFRAAKKISKQSKIAGFRPGKAPYDVVKRIYGEDLINDEAIEISVQDIYPQMIKESEIKPYGPGSLEDVLEKDPPKFKFVIPLEPKIDLKDYLKIRHPYILPEISEEEIQKVIHNLQLNYATAKDKSGKIAEGDLVSVKIDASIEKPNEGQESQILTQSPHQIVIGEDSDSSAYPFPNFSKKLIGKEVHDIFEFKYTFSKDSVFENLRNKKADFKVEIVTIKALEKPEVDDEFSKIVGFENAEELEKSVRVQIENSKREEYENKYFDEVLEKFINKAEIKYPPQMLENEISDVLINFKSQLSSRNMEFETYLKLNKREEAEFIEKDIKPAAKKRLEQALVIETVSKLENIELDQKELQAEYSRSIMQLQSDPDFDKLRKEFTIKKLSDATVMQSATRLMNQRTLSRIKAIANDEKQEKEAIEEKSDPEKVPDKTATPEDKSNKDLIKD